MNRDKTTERHEQALIYQKVRNYEGKKRVKMGEEWLEEELRIEGINWKQVLDMG